MQQSLARPKTKRWANLSSKPSIIVEPNLHAGTLDVQSDHPSEKLQDSFARFWGGPDEGIEYLEKRRLKNNISMIPHHS